MLRPDIKADWADDLESGEYPQGFGALKTEEGYCCLGVLGCVLKDKYPDVLEAAGWEFFPDEGAFVFTRPNGHREVYDSALPDELALSIGLLDGLGKHPLHEMDSLAAYNDDKQWDFGEIAEVIREAY